MLPDHRQGGISFSPPSRPIHRIHSHSPLFSGEMTIPSAGFDPPSSYSQHSPDRRRDHDQFSGPSIEHHSNTYPNPIAPVLRRKSSSTTSRSTTATSSSTNSSSTFMTHPDSNSRRGSSSTNPTTAPPSPSIPTQHRHWVPTTRVPRHIADRHRGGAGGNRWLSDDEGTEAMGEGSSSGSGLRTIGRRRRGSGGAILLSGESASGPSASGSRRASATPAFGSALPDRSTSNGHTTERVDRKRTPDPRHQEYQFRPDLPTSLPKLNTHLPSRTSHTPGSSRPTLRHRPRSSPPKDSKPNIRSSLSVSSSSRDGSRSPPPSSRYEDPPRISDLVPPPNHSSGMRVLRTQMALINPPGPERRESSHVEDGRGRSLGSGLEVGVVGGDEREGAEAMDGIEGAEDTASRRAPSGEPSETATQPGGGGGEDDGGDSARSGSAGGSGESGSGSRSGSGEPVSDPDAARESERKKVWRAGLLGRLKKLLTCTLCPPGTEQLLHHPLTLPCGHTLSSEHLSIPSPAPLPANFITLQPHDQHLLQQQQQHQRLSLWAGIMCPIPTCKRYSPYAMPSGLSHEPSSPVTAFMAPPSVSHAHVPSTPTPVSLASGVMYYPPPLPPPSPSAVHHPPPAYSSEAPINDTGSQLLDTAVDKVMFLVMRELGLGQFSRRASTAVPGMGHVHNEAEHVAAAVHDRGVKLEQSPDLEGEGLQPVVGSDSRRAHLYDESSGAGTSEMHGTLSTGISMDLSSAHLDDLPPTPPSSTSHSHRPKPTPAQTDQRTTSEMSGNTETGSSGSLGRKISKRRKNTQGEPGRPELSFEKELMGILECDVCALLLYQPVTTPCQHSFCGKCLSRSLDHSQRCPVCRQDLPSHAYFTDHAVNRVLLTIIKTAFSTEYSDRQESIERDERDARLDTPIFVCTLAFPGMPTILHVFEPRYRLMIRRCIESDSPRFGMLMPNRGSDGVGEYGTMLEIQSVQMLPDGRSMVETIGTQRFRLLEKGGLDGYTVGRIERIDDISPEEEAALEAEAVRDAAALAASYARTSPPTPSGGPTFPGAMNPSAFHTLLSPQIPPPTSAPPQMLTATHPIALPSPSLPHTPADPKVPPPTSTAELMAVCHSFIDQLRSGSAPWLLQRLNSTYGTMPTDPAEFSYWMALVMPIDENEKARLLPIRSPRLRLKLIVHWVESLRGSWWFSSGCVVG